MTARVDRTGHVYARLSVLKEMGKDGRYPTWLCRCSCGREIVVRGSNLQSGNTRSCGCTRDTQRVKFSHHGMSGTPTHNTWGAMLRRCSDKNRWQYKYYGGRGIKVCERWMSFANFLADMGERPPGKTLDRYPDPDGDYMPSNCRWATQKEQVNNRSRNTLETGRVA